MAVIRARAICDCGSGTRAIEGQGGGADEGDVGGAGVG
jgi:hypothetical protein